MKNIEQDENDNLLIKSKIIKANTLNDLNTSADKHEIELVQKEKDRQKTESIDDQIEGGMLHSK